MCGVSFTTRSNSIYSVLVLTEGLQLGEWEIWSGCPVTCGNGTQWSRRQCYPKRINECLLTKLIRARFCAIQFCPGNTRMK